MKILILSLLRLGDIILHAELVPALKKQYPGCEIHFLINEPFSQAKDIISEVRQWHLLDRVFIEQVLVEQRQSPEAAFDRIEELVTEINNEKFDLVLNATHNALSVRLMDLFQAQEKRGAAFQDGKKVPFNNRWLEYFNDYYSASGKSRFHYVEILHRALDIGLVSPRRQKSKSTGPIYFQVLTSDIKKNWGLERFSQLKELIQVQMPREKIQVLCSPGERAQVLEHFLESEVISVSMAETQVLLRSAKLLVTGDTSIQHLAVRTGTPVISLFIGSADAIKTSPWLSNPILIQSNVGCYPCRASQSCSQKTHACAEMATVQQVFSTMRDFFTGVNSSAKKESLEDLTWRHYLNQERPYGDRKMVNSALDLEIQSLSKKVEDISKGVFGGINHASVGAMAQDIKNHVKKIETNFPEIADWFLKMSYSYEVLDRSFFEFLKTLRAGLKQVQSLQEIRHRIEEVSYERTIE